MFGQRRRAFAQHHRRLRRRRWCESPAPHPRWKCMAVENQPAEVHRRCKECGRRNIVEAAQLGTRCRCAECGALLYPDEASTNVPPSNRPRAVPSSTERVVVAAAPSSGGGLRFVIAVLLIGGAWGFLGGQQAKRVGYNCEVGVGEACWVWKRSAMGQLADELRR